MSEDELIERLGRLIADLGETNEAALVVLHALEVSIFAGCPEQFARVACQFGLNLLVEIPEIDPERN